jgi:serine/threonine protein kinase
LRAALAAPAYGALHTGYEDFVKIGGRDITSVGAGGAGYSQLGACSYVYKARRRGDPAATLLAVKVMLNYSQDRQQSTAIRDQFSAEHDLLSDLRRLPPHGNIMTVLRAFNDDASALPDWNLDPEIVNARTQMVVMPFLPKDLKNVLKALRHAGDEMTDIRVARIAGQLLRALAHLKLHDVVHRDVKLDNILLASPGTDGEVAVLTDFGMCLDFRAHQGLTDSRVPYPIEGFPKGGASIAMAPEIILQRPGSGEFLCYLSAPPRGG